MCSLFFTRTFETKHITDGPFICVGLKIVSISIFLEKLCLGWKLFPISNGRGIGIRMFWVEKN